jgi:hypothetical protein
MTNTAKKYYLVAISELAITNALQKVPQEDTKTIAELNARLIELKGDIKNIDEYFLQREMMSPFFSPFQSEKESASGTIVSARQEG